MCADEHREGRTRRDVYYESKKSKWGWSIAGTFTIYLFVEMNHWGNNKYRGRKLLLQQPKQEHMALEVNKKKGCNSVCPLVGMDATEGWGERQG